MKRVKWGMDAGSVREKGEMGGGGCGNRSQNKGNGGWTREPCVKRVTWGADVGSVHKTGDVEGGCGIRA